MKKKKTHGIQLLVRAVVRDPDGKIISDTGHKPSRSFVIQFLEFIYSMGMGTDRKATDVDGAEDWFYTSGGTSMNLLDIDAAVNEDDIGIVVGTGDTAETNTDYKLETQLTEGITAGKITHGAMDIGTAAVVGANVDEVLKRAFTNLTGDTITVKEAGLYCTSTDMRWHCLIRDVLGTTVDVPDKCSLTVTYTWRTTV